MKRWSKSTLGLVVLWFAPIAQPDVPVPPNTESGSNHQAYRSRPEGTLLSSDSFDLMRQRAEAGEQNQPDMMASGPEALPGCLQPIGHWPYGPTYTLIVSGGYAYYGRGAVLSIADVSDPHRWDLIGEVDVRGSIRGIAISGTRAYVAAGTAGFCVVDISDRKAPVVLGTVDTPGEANALAVMGTGVYLADGESGLLIYDMLNPALPVLVGSFNTPGTAYDVAFFQNCVIVADGSKGLQIIDISDGRSPKLLSDVITGGVAYDVAVTGKRVYVAAGSRGILVIDLSKPKLPRTEFSVDTAGIALSVSVSWPYVYVADGFNGLRIIYQPSYFPYQPGEVACVAPYDYTSDVFLSGDYAYVADRSTVHVLNVSNPLSPKNAGAWLGCGNAWGVAVAGRYLYLADGDGGLTVFDVSNPAHILEGGFYDTPGFAYDVAVTGSYAYVADADEGLQVIDVSDPTKPVLATSYKLGSANSLAISGKYVYVANGGGGLHIFDISNPAAPAITGHRDTPGHAFGVAVSGNYAYVADGTAGLRILDISNLSSLAEVGFCDTPGTASGVAVSGNCAYVADDDHGLQIVDVSNPASPAIVSTVSTGGNALRVAVLGGHAYVGAGPSGLQVINVSNPTAPLAVAGVSTPELATGVVLGGDRVYVADAGAGFYVFSGCGITSECPTVVIQSVNTASCPTVKLKIEVTNSNGQPVTSLTAAAFKIIEDGLAKVFSSTALATAGQYELSYTTGKNDGAKHALDVGVTVGTCNQHATGSYTLCGGGGTNSYEADVAPRDAGGDGTVNSADWAQVGRFAAGLDTAVAGNEFQKADCAPRSSLGNGTITTIDWVQAGRYAAGLDPLTPVGDPGSSHATRAGRSSLADTREAATSFRSLAASHVTVSSGLTISVPIILQSAGDEKALGFSVSFDAGLLGFTGANIASGATGAFLHVNESEKAGGKVGILIGFPGSQKFRAGQRQVVALNFKAATVSAIRSGTISFGDQPILREVADVTASPGTCNYYEGNVAVTTAAPAYSQRLVFPQFVDGGGMTTRFAVFASPNLADSVAGQMRFYNSDGTARSVTVGGITATERAISLSPRGSQFWDTAGGGEQANPGWILIETTGPVHGMATFDLRSDTTLLFSASALGVPPSRKIALPVEDAVKTGVAIVNPGDAPINVKLTLIQKSGVQIEMSPASLNPLGARGHLPQFVDEMTGQADFQGILVIEVVGEGSVAATGLYLDEGVLSGLPVVIVQ